MAASPRVIRAPVKHRLGNELAPLRLGRLSRRRRSVALRSRFSFFAVTALISRCGPAVSTRLERAPCRIRPTYERRVRNSCKTLGSGEKRRRRNNRLKGSGASWLPNRCFTGAGITQAAAGIVRPAADERFAASRKGGRSRHGARASDAVTEYRRNHASRALLAAPAASLRTPRRSFASD